MSEPILIEEGEASPKRVCLPGDINSSDFAPQDESMIDQDLINCAEIYSKEISCDNPIPYYMLSGLSVFCGTFNREPVIVKRVEKKRVQRFGEEALLSLKNLNICKLLHTEEDDSYKYYALECFQASMDQYFLDVNNPSKYNGPMPSDKMFLFQLTDGLDFIHSKQMAHCDIKPENVLIFSSDDGSAVVKWAGFSRATSVGQDGSYILANAQLRGTLIWMAPELLNQLRSSSVRGTVLNDVFSAGLLFFSYLTGGVHPFGSNADKIVDNILKRKGVNFSKLSLNHFARVSIANVMLASSEQGRLNWQQQLKRSCPEPDNESLLNLCSFDDPDTPCKTRLWQLSTNENVDVNRTDMLGRTPLMLLCEKNHSDSFESCFQRLAERRDVNINAKDYSGANALHSLLEFNPKISADVVDQLIFERGIDTTCKKDGMNMLHLLCKYSQGVETAQVAGLLILSGIDVHSSSTPTGDNALTLLTKNWKTPNFMETVQLLIEKKIDVNHKNRDGRNAIQLLIAEKGVDDEIVPEFAHLLITNGLDVNAKNQTGQNIIMELLELDDEEIAMRKYTVKLIRLLIEANIDVNQKNSIGRSALVTLCGNGSSNNDLIEIAQLLIEGGATLGGNGEENVLCLLCKSAQDPILLGVARLLVAKMDFTLLNEGNPNALHCLFENPNNNQHLLQVANLLISSKIDVNAVNSVLHVILKSYKGDDLLDLVRLLIEAGTDVNTLNGAGWNVLHVICYSYDGNDLLDLVLLLVEAGIDVGATVEEGKSALNLLWARKEDIPNACTVAQLLIDSV